MNNNVEKPIDKLNTLRYQPTPKRKMKMLKNQTMTTKKRNELWYKISKAKIPDNAKIFCRDCAEFEWAKFIYGHYVYDSNYGRMIMFAIRNGFIEV